jgi:toxin ParE1/3/4
VFKLNVTPRAESDLIGIWVYTCEEWGVDQADNYLDRLEAGMKRHEDMDAPERLLE